MGNMGKMFYRYLGTKASFISNKYHEREDLANKLVFIGNGECIFARGLFFGNVDEALKNILYFSKISDGTTTASATGPNGTIIFSSDDDSTVNVVAGATGIKIGLHPEFIAEVDAKAEQKDLVAMGIAYQEADNALNQRLAAVEDAVGEGGSVTAQILSALSELDFGESGGDYVKTIKQEDGRITATTGTFNFDIAGSAESAKSEVIGVEGDSSALNTIYGAKKYALEKVNNAIATAATDATSKANQALADAKSDTVSKINALNADKSGESEDTHVKVQVTESAGKISSVVVTTKDIASAEELAKVKADVDYFLGDALNKENAEALKDTLAEIQQYINSDTSGAATMAGNITKAQNAADKAQGEVDALEQVVSNLRSDADATQTALESEISRATAAEEANAANIADIAADYLKKEHEDALKVLIDEKVSQVAYNNDKKALENADEENLTLAKNYAEGLVNDLDVNDTAQTGKYVSAVSQTDGKISVTRASLPSYTLATGTKNGTIKLNNTEVSVYGLKSAAYTEAAAYATAEQGEKADAAAPQATTYTKTEVDAMWEWVEL